jgi:putative nucleotidyltransferase with HDIG domain
VSRRRTRATFDSVLVVDDDDACRTYLAEAFEALGCRVRQAADAGEALRLIAARRPDLVCSDLRMPGLDGLEFLDLLRGHAPGVPCVVVSGCGEVSARTEAQRLGVTAFLPKPVRLADLDALLRHAAVTTPGAKHGPAARAVSVEDASRGSGAIDPQLLYKATQLSLLTRFAGVLRHAGAPPREAAPAAAVVGPVMDRGLDTARLALRADWAAFCVVDRGAARIAGWSGAPDGPLVEQVIAGVGETDRGGAWRGSIGGAPVATAPLVVQGEAVGILCTGRASGRDAFSWSDAELLAAFAEQTAVAVENACLVRQLEQSVHASVTSLVTALEAKHKYTEGHSLRVARYADAIAVGLALPPAIREQVYTAALLHDLGKVGVRDDVLDKCGALEEAEWAAMRQHPMLGARILSSLDFLAEEARTVRSHHERPDGRGYPDGLSGEAIPLAARIIAVADAFDAMRSIRSYRTALSEEAALAELRRGAGTQFDPAAVDAFCAWLAASRGI